MARWLLVAIAALVIAWALLVAVLFLTGRRGDARALAASAVACVVLLRRLAVDRRLARRHRVLLWALVAYLLVPFDLVPDFIPVVGYLDDVLVVVLAVRLVLRAAGPELVREHWSGSERGLEVLLGLAGGGPPRAHYDETGDQPDRARRSGP